MANQETLASTETPHDPHHGPFYLQAEFWVAFAFILVVVSLFKPIKNAGKSMILKRIENIKNSLDEATKLKEDAKNLLAEYEAKFKNADKEAQAILEQSQKEIEYIKKESFAKLDNEIRIKERDAENRIDSAKEKASREIMTLTSRLTIAAVKKTLQKTLDSKTQDTLINNSINLISKL